MDSEQNIKNHKAIVGDPKFHHMMEVAMAEFTRAVLTLNGEHNLNEPGTEQAAALSFQMLSGANNFREVFFRLSDPYAKPQAPKPNPDVLDEIN